VAKRARDSRPGRIVGGREAVGVERTTSGDDAQPVADTISRRSSPRDKLTLFRRLFRSRDDVYAVLWTNARTGAVGYKPARRDGTLLPLTDRVLLDHLQGRHVVGVYPLLHDDTCWFLAVDFDERSWLEDVEAFAITSRELELPVAVERSRSGNGAHAWFFFSVPVPAAAARAFGRFVLSEAAARRRRSSLASFDRLFPNQDGRSGRGFGNLIALPFQLPARTHGNTVFLDEQLRPHADQWAFLARHPRVDAQRVSELAEAEFQAGRDCDHGGAAPWEERSAQAPRATEVVPGVVKATLRQLVYVEKTGLPPNLIREIKRLASFHNPEFYRRQKLRLPTALTPRMISCAEDHPRHVTLPRGCLEKLEQLLAAHDSKLVVDDQRLVGTPLDVAFRGTLVDMQSTGAEKLLAHDSGVVVAPPGFGKTVLGAFLAARRGCSTIVLVHRRQLVDQWVAQLAVHLGLKPSEIGSARRKLTGRLDVVTLQSLARVDRIDERMAHYGHVIVDECHHLPAVSFERVLRAAAGRYFTGLTATPRRRDGLHPILAMQLGPVRFTVSAKAMAAQSGFGRQFIVRPTRSTVSDEKGAALQEVYRQLAADHARNGLIVADVVAAIEAGRSPLVLTERRDHLARLAALIAEHTADVVVLHGGMAKREREKVALALRAPSETEGRVILATGRFAGEGFDDARLDTLVLALPVSWKGTLVQYAGRLHRRHHTKSDVRIFDYVDTQVSHLARMFEKRRAGYRAMGYAEGNFSGTQSAGASTQLALDYRRRRTTHGDSPAATEDGFSAPPAAELDAMIEDITVESFTRHEQALAFLEVIERQLVLPFNAIARGTEVLVERVAVTERGGLIAICASAAQPKRIPLAKIMPSPGTPLGWEWVHAYARWARSGR
jgi:superfamily II DNA or RNA helicase